MLTTAWTLLAGGTLMPYSPLAAVQDFRAMRQADGTVVVRWITTVELGVEAFRLLRVSPSDGTRQPVGSGWVEAGHDEAGHTYAVVDCQAPDVSTRCYVLRLVSRFQPEVDLTTWEGPVLSDKPVAVAAVRAQQLQAPAVSATRPAWIGSGARVPAWTNAWPADRVRLSLRDEGIYRIAFSELAEASGWQLDALAEAVALTNLSLSSQGNPVTWYAEGSNLFFYGVPPQSRFAPENVYWVSLSAGSNMPLRTLTPGVPATTNEWFWDRLFCQGTDYLFRVSYSSLADLPISYTAFNPELISGYSSLMTANPLVDCATGVWDGTITVNLLSFCYGNSGADTYAMRVAVGGTAVGAPAWSGEQYGSWRYPFASSNLSAGSAVLQIENSGPVLGLYRPICISYAYDYPRVYRAVGNVLRCTGGASNTVTVTGFTTNDLLVLDVTHTNLPCLVGPVTLGCDALSSNWSASFSCGDTDRSYVVVSKSTGVRQPSMRGVRDVDWTSPDNAADYVILVPPEGWRADIRPVLQPLADFRNQQGLHTVIVDVESLYNQFSHGLVDPQAIKDFCCTGRTNWPEHPLQYVLLAGAGCLDFQHVRFSVNDNTACLIPTFIGGQQFPEISYGTTVGLDLALGDVSGDAAPEVMVGRLPTTSTQAMDVVVQKTIAYEGAQLWKQQAVVAADWDNTGVQYYPFSASTDQLVPSLLAAGRTVAKSYYNLYPRPSDPGNMLDVKSQSLFPALAVGSGIFHFFGHSNEASLSQGSLVNGNTRLLYSSDITSANWTKPTLAVIIGCRVNRWQYLSPTGTNSIIPRGVLTPGTGFVAGLGATGDILMQDAADLGVAFYAQATNSNLRRLGDVLKTSLQQLTPAEQKRLQSFSLTGDPALVFRSDVTAMGTPYNWLVQNGLTAPNADLSDPNLDGWPVWQDYLAGTDPTNVLFHIGAANFQPGGERLTLAFNTHSNAMYRIFYKADLTTTDAWQAVAWTASHTTNWSQQIIHPTAPVMSLDVPWTPSLATQGFYRVCWTN